MPLLEVASLAFAAALAFTPLLRRIALLTGSLDHPDDRKTHPEPTPLLGGVAVIAALVAGPALAGLAFHSPVRAPHPGILAGGALSLALGLWDDRRPMPPTGKLIGQLAAALVLVYWGTDIPLVRSNPLAGIVALVGVVAVLNAVNFLDAADGVVSVLVPVIAGGFVALALLYGASVDLALAWGLVGACCGFLVYNAPPANIFLGDAGSHLLGFALAALGLQSLEKGLTVPHVAAVLLLLAYPLFDVAFVIVDRLLRHRPIHLAGVDHTTHRLGRLCGQWGVLGVVVTAVGVNTSLGVWTWGCGSSGFAITVLFVSGLAYAVFGVWLRRACPTP